MSGEVTHSTKVLIATARLDSFDRRGEHRRVFTVAGRLRHQTGCASGAGPFLSPQPQARRHTATSRNLNTNTCWNGPGRACFSVHLGDLGGRAL